jgi:1A family penicillin-binding protein
MAKRKDSRHVVISVLLVVSIVLVLSLAAGAVYIAILMRDLPTSTQFGSRKVSQSTKLYDRTGEVLLYEIHGEEKRTVVPFEEIPEFLKEATLAAEDANFYNQPAFNLKGIIRAFIVNLREGRISQGGSTITQQLARSTFLSTEKTITRKVKELILAIELESRYSKDEIFALYLNQIPYGSNAYGVEAASQTYFNKSVHDLTLPEAAIIASLPQAPSYYSPWGSHTEDLFGRVDYVLGRMVELGYTTEEEKEEVKATEVVFAPPSLGTIKAPHFSLAVKEYLVSRYGEEEAVNGGFKVITTLDWEMQQAAEEAVLNGAERNEELYNGKNAALVAQDPRTGQVLAMVGSRDYFDIENEGNFNVAVQGLRQPGSALKPFAYLTAFGKGFHPKSVVFDVPTEFAAQNPDCPPLVDFENENEECFHPENFDDQFRGPVAFEEGLAHSINVPSVKVLYLAGFDDVLSTIHGFGLNTLKERGRYGLSLVLGGGEVKLIELVNAYSTLAGEGTKHEQSLILKIEDGKGNSVEEWNDESERVFESQHVRTLNQILSDTDLRGGLFQSSLPLTIFSEKEVALKTGTTNDYRDAWSIGYTPSLVVGVWAGNNDNSPMQQRGSSILAAVPIWSEFMNKTLDKYPSETFTRPALETPPPKPMLNGLSVYTAIVNGASFPQIHSILYYVKKSDPLGPGPQNPEDDSQFYNWENSVTRWAEKNVAGFFTFNQLLPPSINFEDYAPSSSLISITNVSPQNGTFVSLPLRVAANIKAKNGLSKIELYLNKQFANAVNVSGDSFNYQYYLLGPINSQNLIEIKVFDVLGNQNTVSTIVFR